MIKTIVKVRNFGYREELGLQYDTDYFPKLDSQSKQLGGGGWWLYIQSVRTILPVYLTVHYSKSS